MNRRALYFLLGFAIGGSGLFALILMLVGVQVNYLVWLDTWGGTVGLLLRLLMIMWGALLLVIGTVNWDRELAEVRQAQRSGELSPEASRAN